MFSFTRKIVVCFIIVCINLLFLNATEINLKGNGLNTGFALQVFSNLAGETRENFNFAPLNLSLTLALAANGAESETRSEMLKILGYLNNDLSMANKFNKSLMKHLSETAEDVQVELAQSMWIDHKLTFKKRFLEMNSQFYQADLNYIDLQDPLAPDIINSWVYEKTHGKVFSMVDEVSQDVIIYLLNTIYFKGKWGVQFKEENTKKLEFEQGNGRKKELMFMKTRSENIQWLEGKGFTAVGLPYGEGEFTMYYFLPDETSHIDLFLKKVNAQNWTKWMADFKTQEVVAVVPRVNLNSDITFNDVLQNLGMKKPFTAAAEFGSLCEGQAFITNVKQKTFLSVNEQGTEAAAAAEVVFKKGGCEDIYLTRPFVYALMNNKTNTILLMGIYQN
jgi:serine protease inhibitor